MTVNGNALPLSPPFDCLQGRRSDKLQPTAEGGDP